jgi:tetratricopeptide (TPR) repeat protein
MYENALNITRQTGHKRGMAFELAGLSETLSAQGDLIEARKKGEEALAIRTEMGEQWTTAASHASLAALSLDEGRPEAAEALARQAADEFGKLKADENVAVTYSVLARSLLEQGKIGEAQKVIQSAQELSARSGVIPVHFEVDIAAARGRAAAANHSGQGETAAAKRNLGGVLAKATRHGYVGYEFQSRLALGEIEVKSGKTAAGRARLLALERDAKAKGFLLVARRAAAITAQ